MHRENWDDLRYVLAVAKNGSVSAAARSLGVNHATVLRRIAAFEERYDCEVFEKTPRGYSLPENRTRLVELAREAEAAMLAVSRLIEGVQAPLSGSVRVTSTDTFCHELLPPVIAGLHAEASELHVDLICSNAHLDLARLDADITVRPAASLPDDLVGEVAGHLGFAVYQAPGGADQWLGLSGAISRSRPALWMAEAVAPEQIVASADSFLTLRELAAAGLGHSVLPCFLADSDPRLRRLPMPLPDHSVEIWVACHADLVNVPRISAVLRYLRAAVATKADMLAGSGAEHD